MSNTYACEEQEQEVELTTLCDEDRREIYITGSIDNNVYQNVFAAIRHLDETKGNINLIINTDGGECAAGFSICDVIRVSKNKVIAHCVGECMSIGMAIISVCDGRISYPNTRFMVHEVKTVLSEGYMAVNEIERTMKETKVLNDIYMNILFEGCDLTFNEVKALCEKETFMSPDQAFGYGFIDGIYDSKPVKKAKSKKSNKKVRN